MPAGHPVALQRVPKAPQGAVPRNVATATHPRGQKVAVNRTVVASLQDVVVNRTVVVDLREADPANQIPTGRREVNAESQAVPVVGHSRAAASTWGAAAFRIPSGASRPTSALSASVAAALRSLALALERAQPPDRSRRSAMSGVAAEVAAALVEAPRQGTARHRRAVAVRCLGRMDGGSGGWGSGRGSAYYS
jgi:hypothetical protein